ncbi:MAG: universal stress protein [Anaerolineales bacterium]|nr:MAG: universal stress protein [Anaerolineales bacterium]
MNTKQIARPLDILLGVDGSEHSIAAARLLCDLPLQPGSSITALSVLAPTQSPGKAALLTALERVATILQSEGIEVKTGLLHGHPAEQLSDFADRHQTDLLVVGARGLRATLGILLGGVAQQVVEYAKWPVLVVRAPYQTLRRVLMVTDGSIYSHQAVDYLLQFPLPKFTEVRIMHVLPSLPSTAAWVQYWPAGLGDMPPMEDLDESLIRQAKEDEKKAKPMLAEAEQRLRQAGLRVSSVLTRGDAATEIIEYTQSHEIDLLVAGSRGLSQMRGWLLGSVSRKLIHYAGCSVLVVRCAET